MAEEPKEASADPTVEDRPDENAVVPARRALPADDEATEPNQRRATIFGWARIIAPIVLFFIAFGLVLSLYLGSRQTDDGRNTPVWSPTSSATPTPATAPTPLAASLIAGCQPQKEIVPTKFIISRMNVDSQVLSLGWDPATGAAEAPPDKDAYSVGWLNEGPKPGSSKGNIVLTSHTYHVGRALGNDLYDTGNGLRAGDIIKMSDASGYTVCYEFRESIKVWVADYNKNPNTNVLYDNEGRPQIALVVCWDWDWKARSSASRIIFYADPVVVTA